jgi:two-component system response regulator RegA
MNDRPLVLIVEDDERLRLRLAKALDLRGFDVRVAASAAEAEAALAVETPECVVLDLKMPDGTGLDLIPRFKQADPETRIVVLTGYGSIATAMEAVRRGATDYLTKPADADDIVAAFGRTESSNGADAPFRPMSLDRVEWEHINRVLLETQHNISEAARRLGIHRRSLQRKLAKHPPAR